MAYQKGKYKNTNYKKSSKSMAQKNKENSEFVVESLLKFFDGADSGFDEDEHNQDVQFFKPALKALPRSHNNDKSKDNALYRGVNIVLLMATKKEATWNVPLFTTRNKMIKVLENYKPEATETFDPEKPFKGIFDEATCITKIETYKITDPKNKDKQLVLNDTNFPNMTKEQISKLKIVIDNMTYEQRKANGYFKQEGVKKYGVIPLERFKGILPESFFDKYEYFKMQEELDEKLRMNPDYENEHFLSETKIMIEAMKADGLKITEKDTGRAYYNYMADEVVIPPRHRFNSDIAYFSVIRHELTHATGSVKRLDRETKTNAFGNKFGTPAYAREEVVAELGTCFACIEQGTKTFFNHAKYIKGWASATAEESTKTLIKAVGDAQEAQQYISDRVLEYKLKMGLIVEKELKEEESKKKPKVKVKP